MDFWIALLGFFLLLFIMLQYAGRLFYGYRATESGIEIKLFHFLVIKKFDFTNIAEIWPVTFWDLIPFYNLRAIAVARWGNRVFSNGIVLRIKKGILNNYVAISPNNRDQFLDSVRAKEEAKNIIFHNDGRF